MFKLSILIVLFCSVSVSVASDKPNIIFILTDDQRHDFLGCSGHPILQTPNIDKLAAAGTRFENAFVTTSTCWISRASIYSGVRLRTHRYRTGREVFSPKWAAQSYPVLLRQAGYKVGYIGKSHVRLNQKDQQKMFDQFTVLRRNPYFKKQKDGTLKHLTQICGDKAIDFLKVQQKEKPFCLAVTFNAAHAEDSDRKNHYPYPKAVAHLYKDMKMPLPKLNDSKVFNSMPAFLQNSMHKDRFKWRWDTPEKYQHNMRNYLRMISGVDLVTGRILRALEDRGLAENTIIIYSADNGYYAGERGFAGKWTHFDESLRVPLIVFDPRLKNGPQKLSKSMALNIDIPATILNYAGVKIPKTYQGRSLKPIVEGEVPADWRQDSFCEFFSSHKTIPNWEGIRGERYVYVRYVDGDKPYEFLHDLKADPQQLKNFANNPEYKEILVKWRRLCSEQAKSYGADFSKN